MWKDIWLKPRSTFIVNSNQSIIQPCCSWVDVSAVTSAVVYLNFEMPYATFVIPAGAQVSFLFETASPLDPSSWFCFASTHLGPNSGVYSVSQSFEIPNAQQTLLGLLRWRIDVTGMLESVDSVSQLMVESMAMVKVI